MEAQTLNGLSIQKIYFQPDVNLASPAHRGGELRIAVLILCINPARN
jgi:hypothetical protein